MLQIFQSELNDNQFQENLCRSKPDYHFTTGSQDWFYKERISVLVICKVLRSFSIQYCPYLIGLRMSFAEVKDLKTDINFILIEFKQNHCVYET